MKKLFLIAAAVLLCQCEDRADVHGWAGATPDDADAMFVYEQEMLYNSLPPCID